MKKFHQISGFVAVPVMVFSALVGLGLLGGMIFKNNNGLSSLNKGSLSAQVSQTFNVYRTLNICSSPDELLTLSSTCQTARCGTHFGAAEYYACSGTCAGGVNSPQTCALQSITTTSIVYRTLNICSSPDELTLSSTCQTARCGTHFGAAEYYACSGTCAGGVNSPQTCALQQVSTTPSIKVLSPNGGENWTAGETYNITWNSTNISKVTVRLFAYYATTQIPISEWIASGIPNNNSVSFKVPLNLPQSEYLIQVYGDEDSSGNYIKVNGQSDVPFTITVPASALKVTVPNGGETWQIGSLHTIQWTPYDPQTGVNVVPTVSAYLEKLVSGSFVTVGKIIESGKASIHWIGDLDNYGNYPEPGYYFVRVVNSQTGQWDRSDGTFQLVAQGTVKADLKINGSDGPISLPAAGGTVTFSWTSSSADTCDLYLNGLADDLKGLPPSGQKDIFLKQNPYEGQLAMALGCSSAIGSTFDKDVFISPYSKEGSYVKITSPNGGENIVSSSIQKEINWVYSSDINKFSIALYKNDAFFKWIFSDLPWPGGLGSITWNPSSVVSSSDIGQVFKIYIIGYKTSGGTVEDKSDAPFTITAPIFNIPTSPFLGISVSTQPPAQNVIAGSNQFEFARYILDAGASSEDLRMTSLPLWYSVVSGNATDLTNCKLYDGSTVLTTGNNVVNPSATGSSIKFTFDGTGLTLSKGTSKQLSLKCDLKAGATGMYQWGFDGSSSFPSATGLTSGQKADISATINPGSLMTVAGAGALSVSLDSVSPYKIASPGQTVVLAQLRFSATGENIAVKQVALQLSNPELNTPTDLVGQLVTLWDGATQVGQAVFASGDNAISSAITNFVAPAGGSKVLTVKGVIANISVFGPLTKSGDLLKVDYDGGGVGFEQKGNYGVGQSSGQNVFVTGSDTNSTGVRIMKAYPEFELIPLTVAEKVLPSVAQDNVTLYKFKVTAKNGDLAIAKFTFQINSKNYDTNLVSNVGLYAFTNSSYSSPDGNFTGGLLNFGQCYNKAREPFVEIYPDKTGCNQSRTSLKIPSGESRWFKLRASVSNLAVTQQAISVQLEGDGNYLLDGIMQSASGVDHNLNDFIWSPRSTSTNENDVNYQYNLDWTNGYGVVGLPSDNLPAQTLTVSGYSDSSGQQTISALQAQIEALLQQIKSLQDQLLQQRFSQPLPSAVPATLKSPASTPSTAAPAKTKSSVPTQSVAPTAVKPAETVVITPVKSRETFSHTWNVDLNYGLSNNADVRALQNALILENVYKGEITGGFFSATRQGVVEFQKKYNLPEYGFVGKYTRAKLNELYSK